MSYMVYYCMNSELPLIQSTENDIINIMGSSKNAKTDKQCKKRTTKNRWHFKNKDPESGRKFKKKDPESGRNIV